MRHLPLADLGGEHWATIGRLRLRYTTTTAGGEKRDSDYPIILVTTQQPFGGRRWWFNCPRTGDLVSKLYLPNGAYMA